MSLITPINMYTCDTCHGAIVTIDRAEGVTPMLLACRASETCKGMMHSHWYAHSVQNYKPNYEWYRPAKLDEFDEGMKDHIQSGGLVLRKIE